MHRALERDGMEGLCEEILSCVSKTGFSGVISVQIGSSSFAKAFGYRDRANSLENQLSTRFGIASGTKGFTAVGVARLIEEKQIGFSTLATHVLGDSVKNLHPEITVAHLLEHTSGIGDYLDEEKIQDINDVVLAVPVQDLASPVDYAAMIEKEAQKFPPGARFCYSNSGYVVLAMIIELVSREPYHGFIEAQVFQRAGMIRSGLFRSDQLPEDTALGYVPDGDAWRTNVFHLPVRGGGDGGAYTTLEDMRKFWRSLSGFQLVNEALVAELLQPRQYSESEKLSYGFGFWMDELADQIILEGYDAGVSFRSATGRQCDDGYTVISNTSSGVWPMVRLLTPYFQQGVSRLPATS
jgi:CubicO group peptidase (beta-lactamase class C family)